jgi:hypothetical protein
MEILDDGINAIPPIAPIELGRLQHDAEMGLSQIKNARTAFFVLAGSSVFSLFLGLLTNKAVEPVYVIIEGVIMIALFIAAALAVNPWPKVAIITGFSIYLLIILLNFIVSPASLFTGMILKVVVIYYLVKGIGGAVAFEKANEEMKTYGHEMKVSW